LRRFLSNFKKYSNSNSKLIYPLRKYKKIRNRPSPVSQKSKLYFTALIKTARKNHLLFAEPENAPAENFISCVLKTELMKLS
jgi:hypothetical protein